MAERQRLNHNFASRLTRRQLLTAIGATALGVGTSSLITDSAEATQKPLGSKLDSGMRQANKLDMGDVVVYSVIFGPIVGLGVYAAFSMLGESNEKASRERREAMCCGNNRAPDPILCSDCPILTDKPR